MGLTSKILSIQLELITIQTMFTYLKQSFITYLEREPFERITKNKQFVAFKHKGFWQCMDTKRDLDLLETMWERGEHAW